VFPAARGVATLNSPFEWIVGSWKRKAHGQGFSNRGHPEHEECKVNSNDELILAINLVVDLAINIEIERRVFGVRGRRGSIQDAFLRPGDAFLGFHSLRLATLDFLLSLLKSGSLSACHRGSFRGVVGD
jgi:hypothetical protein